MEAPAQVCRLCLLPSRESKSSIRGKEMRSQLEVIFKFELPDDGSLPDSVCTKCTTKVAEFHDFHESVRANQNQLTASLHDSKDNLLMLVEIKGEPMVILEEDGEQGSIQGNMSKPDTNEDDQAEAESDQDGNDRDDGEQSSGDEDGEEEEEEADNKKADKKKRRKMGQDEDQKILNFFGFIHCSVCKENFESFDQLHKHSRKVHKAKWSMSCCDRTFKRKFLLLDHIDFHLNPNKYYCEICKKGLKTRYYLDIHNRRLHCGQEENPFVCDQCGKRFPNRSILNAHVLKHTKVQCTLCEKPLANTASLRAHMALVHSGPSSKPHKLHMCDTCGKSYKTKSSLDQHTKQHQANGAPEKVQCPFCQKMITSKQYLRVHIKMLHSGDVRQTCDICQQVYPNRRALNSHRSTVHVERNHECEVCGKKFKHTRHLREHRAAHTGERLYACTVCGVTSNNNGNLYAHMKSKHPQEWAEAKARGECLLAKNESVNTQG